MMTFLPRRGGMVHAIAGCRDCSWVAKNWKNAQANAATHARAHGHTTWVEVGLAFTYGPGAAS